MSWLRAVMISCVKLNTKVAILLSLVTYISSENELTAAKVWMFLYFAIYTLYTSVFGLYILYLCIHSSICGRYT